MKKYFAFFSILLIALSFISCNHQVFYEKVDHIPHETWNIDSVLHYEVEITDSLEFYNMYIHLRNTVDFETQYFYVFMTTEFPNGYIGKDTLGFVVSDLYGKWTGTGMGRIKDNFFLFKKQVRFAHKGTYKFSVVQGMRQEDVKGISDFGLSLHYFEKDKK